MAEKYVKEVTTESGKKKFRAEVWYQGKFYTSKTFDSRPLAVMYKERQYKEVVAGRLLPAADRRERRKTGSSLSSPMRKWAELYVEEFADTVGKMRLNEYLLVGRLTQDKSLKDFNGRAGAKLVAALQKQWLAGKRLECCPFRGSQLEVRPLRPATVRLRMTALLRLIRFASSKLPDDAGFVPPALDLEFEFALPPSHSTPRTVEASDADYATLLRHFGEESDFGHFLQVIDETGCRLGEVLNAASDRLDFFRSGGAVVGGCLTLTQHKTSRKTKKARHIPLSMTAATILASRVKRLGKGRLFPSLGNTDKVCKTFDDARTEVSLGDLLIKDFRRAFINRNKSCVSRLDMHHIVGQSNLLGAQRMSPSESAVTEAVGHTNLKTTAGYSVPRMEELALVFTRTSRTSRVTGKALPLQASEEVLVGELQARLAETLGALRRLGVVSPLQSHGAFEAYGSSLLSAERPGIRPQMEAAEPLASIPAESESTQQIDYALTGSNVVPFRLRAVKRVA